MQPNPNLMGWPVGEQIAQALTQAGTGQMTNVLTKILGLPQAQQNTGFSDQQNFVAKIIQDKMRGKNNLFGEPTPLSAADIEQIKVLSRGMPPQLQELIIQSLLGQGGGLGAPPPVPQNLSERRLQQGQ